MSRTTEPLLGHLMHVAQRIRATDDHLSHPDDVPGGDTFMGVPIVTSMNVGRDQVWNLGYDIALHPFTCHALAVALSTGRRTDDPSVQRETADWWVQQRIDRMASAALDGIDRLTFAYTAQAVVDHATRWCDLGQDRHRYTVGSRIANTWVCTVCHHTATDEAIVRSGAVHYGTDWVEAR